MTEIKLTLYSLHELRLLLNVYITIKRLCAQLLTITLLAFKKIKLGC
jgi:hypothetical protein